jgi:hypothetical protein
MLRVREQVAQTVITCRQEHRRMIDELHPKADPGATTVYQIRVKGHLGPQWTDWFEGLAITLEDNGETVLTGPVADQAALHGLLRKVRDLGLPLRAVQCIEPDQTAAPDKTPPHRSEEA